MVAPGARRGLCLTVKTLQLVFLRMMLRMPAMPSGSYFADGLVMTSTRSMELAGICSRNAFWAAPVNPEGLPSMRICT